MLGFGATPLRYRVNFDLNESLAMINQDEAWQSEIGEFMEVQRRNNLLMLGVAVVGTAALTYTGAGFIFFGLNAAGFTGMFASFAFFSTPGFVSGYGAVRLGMSAIARTKAVIRGELPADEYVSCRCISDDGEAAYHTGRVGWWAEWREDTDEELAVSCFRGALKSGSRAARRRRAAQSAAPRCDVAFLR